jgi:hypothetical protein
MQPSRIGPSPSEVTSEIVTLSAGLGILTMALFPIALPGLLLFVVAPLALVAVPALLLAGLLIPPLWLARRVSRRRSRRSRAANLPGDVAPPVVAVGGANPEPRPLQ